MKKSKNYFLVLLLLNFVSQVIPADDIEKQDITKLVQYLKQRDDDQKKLQQDIKKLWGECFRINIDVSYCGNTRTTKTTYSPYSWCPSSKFKQLYENRQELHNFRYDTQKQIGKIINDGVLINACDDNGKTALNHAQSRDQYNALRKLGANFQVDAFAKTNESQLIAVAILAAAWGYLLTDAMNVTVEKKKNALIDTEINTRDERGRTPLMNYTIEREAQLDSCRNCMFSPSILLFVLNTNAEITRMVECGADLSIKDYHGKTIMDYCKTAAIYDHLRSLGGDFNLNNWAYTNADYLIPCVAITAFILAIIKITTFEFSLDHDGEIGRKFDNMFRSGSF